MKLFRVVAVEKGSITMMFRVLAKDIEAAHKLGAACAMQPVRVIEL